MTDEVLEMNRYYDHATIGIIGEKGKIEPVTFRQIDKIGNGKYNLRYIKGDAVHEMEYDPSKLFLGFPRTGMINYGRYVVYTYRATDRQWRKGVTNDNILVNNYRVEFGATFFDNRFNKSSKTFLNQLYNNTYFSPDEAIKEIRGAKRLGCAISHNLALGVYRHLGKPVILYKGRGAVGYLDDDDNVVLTTKYAYLREGLDKFFKVKEA